MTPAHTTHRGDPPLAAAHHLDDDALVALAVEFGVENALPRAQIEFACGDGHDHLMMYQQGLQVRVAVVLAGLVVTVVLAEGRQRLQPLVDVVDQARLVVVDVNSGSDVHGRHERHAFSHAALLHRRLHLRRDMNVGAMFPGVKGQVFRVNFHADRAC